MEKNRPLKIIINIFENEFVFDVLKKAYFIRNFENKLLELYKTGILNGTVHTCVGQELIPVILNSFIKNGDKVFSNHRGHGHYLSLVRSCPFICRNNGT